MRSALFNFSMHCSIFWIISFTPVIAQYSDENFVRYTVKDGLSDNNITCIDQDSRGYIWIGTEIGLNRFDGSQFKNSYKGYSGHLLPSSNIRKLYSVKNDRLIIVTTNGFQVLNVMTGLHQDFTIPDSTPFVTLRNLVWDVIEMDDGSFAAATASGFYVFDQHGAIIFQHDAYSLKDIGIKRIFYGRNIFSVPGNQLLVYVEQMKLAHYQPEKHAFHELTIADTIWKSFLHPARENGGPWISRNQISDHEYIFQPTADSIIYYNYTQKKRVTSPLSFRWIDEFTYESHVCMLNDSTFLVNGGFNGFYLYHIDRRSGQITGGQKKFLPAFKINALFLDKDKRLWIGTTKGLLRQAIHMSMIETYDWSVGDFSIDGYVDAIRYEDKLYLARFSRDAGLVIVDTATMQIKEQIHFYGLKNDWNEINTIQMFYRDTFWLGSSQGILWFDTKSNRYGKVVELLKLPSSFPRIQVLAPSRPDGYAWMCAELRGVVARYNLKLRTFDLFSATSNPPLPFEKVKSIAYDAFGDVWVSGHSLTRWNNQEQRFDTLITVYGGANKYYDDILMMAADDDGSLWLHNNENGLLEYKIKEKKFINYSMKEGLPSDVLRCFSPVIDHTLWIGSHNNLSKFNTASKKIDVYGYRDGVPEQKPSSRKIITDKQTSKMYMFYVDKVIRFPIEPVSYPDLGSDLLVEELIVNNNKIFPFPSEHIHLSSTENNLYVKYTIINFESSQNYQFAYSFNNADSWTNVGDQRALNLNNLSSGQYTLHLMATGRSGLTKTVVFTFSISAPLWKRPWFIALSFALLGSLIFLAYKSRIASFRKKANLDKLLSQTEMKALHAQMNPHFIFNSLNSIREMILNNENKEASRYLSKFAHLIRVTLDQSGQSFISLRNTIDYLERYIEMEKIRNVHFNCRITVDTDLEIDDTIMPPMLIQPFIENAIWHGTSSDHAQIDIHVQFKKQNGQLICIVDDDGIGIDRSLSRKSESDRMHHSVGISNIKSRIQLLNKKHNLQSSISVEDKSGVPGRPATGTRVTLKLPLEIAEE
ncbi:MAG TPA: histidine kinase [Saprospiraceae bacterium]|nr:histidine kinase [Saprospiraceae bacterium]